MKLGNLIPGIRKNQAKFKVYHCHQPYDINCKTALSTEDEKRYSCVGLSFHDSDLVHKIETWQIQHMYIQSGTNES